MKSTLVIWWLPSNKVFKGGFLGASCRSLIDGSHIYHMVFFQLIFLLMIFLKNVFSGHFRTGSEVSTCPSEDSSVAPSLETEKLLKKLAEMSEILEARETKLVELSRSNLELQEKNTDLTSQVREAKKINSKLNEANISSEEFTQRLSTMEKKLQQTIAERDKFKEESKILKIELASKLPDSDIAEKDEIITDLRAEGNCTYHDFIFVELTV